MSELNAMVAAQAGSLVVNVKTASQMLSVSERTLWRLVKKGKLAVVHLGDRRLFSIAELQRLIKAESRLHVVDQ